MARAVAFPVLFVLRGVGAFNEMTHPVSVLITVSSSFESKASESSDSDVSRFSSQRLTKLSSSEHSGSNEVFSSMIEKKRVKTKKWCVVVVVGCYLTFAAVYGVDPTMYSVVTE